MSSLKDYDGIRQSSPNSCGAFAVASVLAQLGHVPWSNNAHPAEGEPTQFAEQIYQVTGNLEINFQTAQATYGYTDPVSGRNSPSKMVYEAGVNGIDKRRMIVKYNNGADQTFQAITVMNADANGASLLEYETDLIVPDLAYEVGPLDYTTPFPNEVHIVLVNDNQHWIVVAKELLYDPASGYVGAYSSEVDPETNTVKFAYTDQDHAITSYTFSGLWIQFS